MRPETRLDSAVFQLTPTRTRCDLVIIANGKQEKIASGLLNPFLAHLKTARDQIDKGGYSIPLEPDPESGAAWFTKGTVERFVRFVSTPEVLERVTTIESEILQIENSIAIQSNDSLGFSAVEDHQAKVAEGNDGSKATGEAESEKAIVIYKPDSQPQLPDSNGSSTSEENSKIKLLKVLETRKIVLQKEQGMAFARAVAAGFDMDNMVDLISFAQSFGASRLREACIKFVDLWKKKHETGQWIDVEAAEVASRSEFSYLNASGIVLAEDMLRQKEHGGTWPLSGGDAVSENNENTDKQTPSEQKMPIPPEFLPGQFQHPAYPQWAMHPQPGPAVFQPYMMPGMPYYQNYPGGMPYFPPPYPPTDDPRYNTSHRRRSKRHSIDNSNIESEERSTRSQDDTDENLTDTEKESSRGCESHKKVSSSAKKKPGVVVIRNLNYISSKKHGASESGTESASSSESEQSEDLHSSTHRRKNKSSKKASKKEEGHTKYADNSSTYSKDELVFGQETDSGNWQAFQSFLLNAEEKARTADSDMFSGEKAPSTKKKQNKSDMEPIILPGRDFGDNSGQKMVGFDSVNGQASRLKQASSNDALLISNEGRVLADGQFKEIEGGGGAYRRMSNDDFMIYGQDKHYINNSSDPLADQAYHPVGTIDNRSSHNITDDSFLLPHRSGMQDNLGPHNRTTIDIDSELPSSLQNAQDNIRPKVQVSYEPDDLSLVPQRGNERVSISYDPALDYEIQLPVENIRTPDDKTQEDVSINTKEEVKKSEKKNSRASQDSLEKKRKETMVKKVTPSRIYPSAEAQKRAENLRAFKGNLQKLKKEQEEENMRRLEALKLERQKRIAARSGSNVTQSPSTPEQIKARVVNKVSPGSYKSSKFSDSEPVASPLRKIPTRTTSVGLSDPQKVTKTSRVNDSSQGLTRSVSSLPDATKQNDGLLPEAKTASLRIKRLSEPKGSFVQGASARNSVPNDQTAKRVRDESQTKKISAIMQLDQSKSATLPELKIKSSKTTLEAVQKKSKDTSQRGTGNKSSLTSHNVEGRDHDRPSSRNNSEDNLVIEKTVVMLEKNVPPAPIIQLSQGSASTEEKSYAEESSPVYAGILAPPSPMILGQVDNSAGSKLDEQVNPMEVVTDYSKEDSKFSNSLITEKPYQAPHARASSMEHLATTDLGYARAVPVPESGIVMTHSESIKAQVPSFQESNSVDQIQGASEKPRKEAKGFRKLLKFGRKSHNSASGEGNHDLDASSVDDHAVTIASSNDAHLLKHLISQDDTHIGSAPAKVSRFSLLSPFRSKNSEKKLEA